MLKYIIFTLIFSINAQASWLCKEAASQAEDNIFYACGHSEADKLDTARDLSLENAKNEFKKFCNESENCKNQAYVISPMRTDCAEVNKKFICDRGLQYTILPQKKSTMMIDRKEIDILITEKEKELEVLRENMQKLSQLAALTSEIKEVEKIDQSEAALTYLKTIKEEYVAPKVQKESLSFNFVRISTPIKKNINKNVSTSGLGFYAKSLYFWNISLRFGGSYLFPGDAEPDISLRGSPSSTSKEEFYNYSGFDFHVGLTSSFDNLHISLLVGDTALKYKSLQRSYNSLGVVDGRIEKDYSSNTNYIGVGFRYGNKFFGEVEPRYFIKEKIKTLNLVIGYCIEL